MPAISNDYCMTKGLCFLVYLSCSQVHLLGLIQLALSLMEDAQVNDGVECGCILRA